MAEQQKRRTVGYLGMEVEGPAVRRGEAGTRTSYFSAACCMQSGRTDTTAQRFGGAGHWKAGVRG